MSSEPVLMSIVEASRKRRARNGLERDKVLGSKTKTKLKETGKERRRRRRKIGDDLKRKIYI